MVFFILWNERRKVENSIIGVTFGVYEDYTQ